MANGLKGLLCSPGSKPRIIEISNDIAVIEELLEGRLGIKELEENGICILFNDDGHKKVLDLNRVVQGDPIFGSCIFCRKQGDQLLSLTEDEIKDLEYLLG